MTGAWLAGGIAIILMITAIHHPTLRDIQRRIIALRAAYMLAPRMWESAIERARADWPEMLRRAASDVFDGR